jgi:predicted polyphosphate/ATP-dependent NAD kinase
MRGSKPELRIERPRSSETVKRVGLIVNPIAGLGGAAGLKGSDAPDIRARTADRIPLAGVRASQALDAMARAGSRPRLLTVAGAMGGHSAAQAGWRWEELPYHPRAVTSARDTRRAAELVEDAAVDLLLFGGGDGTAVDILAAIGDRVPVVGIPAGVKMHSGAFAVSASAAGRLAARFLGDHERRTAAADVLDLDEAALRRGVLAGGLCGVVRVPVARDLVQSAKVRTSAAQAQAVAEVGRALVREMAREVSYVIGPGTTTGAVLEALGLRHTLLGVDVVRDRRLIAADVDDRRLEAAISAGPAVLVLTPIGGQGFLLGRGNQQIGARLVDRCGADGVIVVATEAKLATLRGRPLLIDTGDTAVDARVVATGYVRVVLGEGRSAWYPIASAA